MTISASGGPAGKAPGQMNLAAAADAEKEARDRIQSAHKQTVEAQRQAESRVDQLKDEYIRQSENQQARHEETYESQKQKNYESLRNLKRAQEAELNRIRRQGEKDLQQSKTHYRDAVYQTERNAQQELKSLQVQNFNQSEYQKKLAADQTAAAREAYAKQIESLKSEQGENYSKILATTQEENNQLKTRSAAEIEKADEVFQARFKNTKAHQEELIHDLNARASEQVEEIRQDTSLNLNAYSERQEDPFYKLVDIGAKLHENENEFVLVAKIPEHERNRVSINIRGDEVVISGTRSSDEKLDLGPGRKQSTASFQSYSESFPLTWPVEAKKLTREFSGDQLIVRVPKKEHYDPAPYKAKKAERVRLERPQFPMNLPIRAEDQAKKDSEGVALSPKKKGSRPLS